jgi:hypothetical protein
MDIEDEEPWLRATIGHLRKAIPLVGTKPRAEAALQTMAKAMERRLAALEQHQWAGPPGHLWAIGAAYRLAAGEVILAILASGRWSR